MFVLINMEFKKYIICITCFTKTQHIPLLVMDIKSLWRCPAIQHPLPKALDADDAWDEDADVPTDFCPTPNTSCHPSPNPNPNLHSLSGDLYVRGPKLCWKCHRKIQHDNKG